jgi:hypothetical protein
MSKEDWSLASYLQLEKFGTNRNFMCKSAISEGSSTTTTTAAASWLHEEEEERRKASASCVKCK